MDAFDKLMLVYAHIRAENDEPLEQPPASIAAIHVAAAAIELVLPPVLERLYAWHNGILHLNAFLHFLPLREAVQNYRSNMESRRSGWLPEIGPNWFPVLDINGDIQFCVDVVNGEVWAVDLEGQTVRRLATHYETLLDALLASFERGLALFQPNSGAFEVAPNDWAALREEFGLDVAR